MTDAKAAQVLAWWQSIGPQAWFSRDDAIDAHIRSEFSALHARAAGGELDAWRQQPESSLALVILLDQFSRNLFRGDRRAFAQDALARSVADEAVARGFDRLFTPELAVFFHMPFMHSESIADQDRCLKLIHSIGRHYNLGYARSHREIIWRFGRFPHRNVVIGRHTTPAEATFLDSGGFSG